MKDIIYNSGVDNNVYFKLIDDYVYISLDLTQYCNLNCKYCIRNSIKYESQEFEYTLDNFNLFIEFLKLQNKQVLLEIVGGEPTIHPNFIDFINILYKEFPNIYIKLLTNGTADLALYKQLPTNVTVSITCHTDENIDIINIIPKYLKMIQYFDNIHFKLLDSNDIDRLQYIIRAFQKYNIDNYLTEINSVYCNLNDFTTDSIYEREPKNLFEKYKNINKNTTNMKGLICFPKIDITNTMNCLQCNTIKCTLKKPKKLIPWTLCTKTTCSVFDIVTPKLSISEFNKLWIK